MRRPIVQFLRLVDSDQAVAGKVYHRFFALKETIKDMEIDENKKAEIIPLIEERWEQAHSEMHSAGYALDPEFCTHDLTSNSEVCLPHA